MCCVGVNEPEMSHGTAAEHAVNIEPCGEHATPSPHAAQGLATTSKKNVNGGRVTACFWPNLSETADTLIGCATCESHMCAPLYVMAI